MYQQFIHTQLVEERRRMFECRAANHRLFRRIRSQRNAQH